MRKFLSEIGRKGGKRSRRKLDPDTARRMVRVREAKRAFRRFYARCFWSFDPEYRITWNDVEWVAEHLKRHGDRAAWALGVKLCR
ncbi:MAG: hypothetical protein ACYS47_21415 [Planctomycetota bacterium]